MRSVPIAPVPACCPLKGKDLFRHAPVHPPHGGIFLPQRVPAVALLARNAKSLTPQTLPTPIRCPKPPRA